MAGTKAAPKPTRAAEPGPLVTVDWLADHLDDPISGSSTRRPTGGSTTSATSPARPTAISTRLALRGTAPETGDAEREWLVPSREQAEAVLRRWRVGDGDRVVLYDDVGLNRHAIRGYWLLRLYGFPKDGPHPRWRHRSLATRRTADDDRRPRGRPRRRPAGPGQARRPRRLPPRDLRRGPGLEPRVEPRRGRPDPHPRRPDGGRVRRRRPPGEAWRAHPGRAPAVFRRPADRRGHVPAGRRDGRARPRPAPTPAEIRATYCQGGVRAALAWFVLHELAGFDGVRSYAGSWEEWGNRDDSPIESP